MVIILRKLKNSLRRLLVRMAPKKNASEIFDNIYVNNKWGGSGDTTFFSGDGSHDRIVVDSYVSSVRAEFSSEERLSAVDVGCGDFSVGNRICDIFERYIAVDASEQIINQNINRYSKEGLSFTALDATKDHVPRADVIFIRQVLQHLSNTDIKSLLSNVKSTGARYLVLTEHLPKEEVFSANIDIPTGAGIRLGLGSGIDISKEPFNFESASHREILSIPVHAEGKHSRIVTTKFTLY